MINTKYHLLRNTFLTAAMAMTIQLLAHAQQPWQKIQMPTAAEVASGWKTPPPEYGPEPYYGFSGVMNETVIRRDLDHMKALGYQAVTVQAGRDMPDPYLSEPYFKLFRVFVEEAKNRDMRVWIVDDIGYPSGFAGGKFTELKPDLRMQALVLAQKIAVAGGDTLSQPISPATMAVLAVNSEGASQAVPVTNGALRWTVPRGKWTVLVVEHQFRTSPTRSDTNPKRLKDTSQSLEDYLNPAATMQYLAFTHEQYKRYVGDEFGKTIMGFRGDEPDYSISGIPWTPALFDRFRQIKGYDVRPYVASFFAPNMTEEQRRVKADYWDVFSVMFRDGFFKPQAAWCAANQLEYQVHLNHEEAEMQLVRSEGDFFRDMRYVQIPGIDAIWHQIWTDTISDYPRLAASAAHVYGKPRAFTESFAAYRPIPNVGQAQYILNVQFVRGVNQVEVMFLPSTTAGRQATSALMSEPDFPELMQYTRRLSYLMSMGRPGASVALYLPSSSLWLNDQAADRAFVATEQLLSEHQIDFDIVDENALATELVLGRGTFETLSGNRFRTVILPGEILLSQAVLDRLRALARKGGHVLFLDHAPSLIAGRSIRDARPATSADFSWASTETSVQLPPTPTPPMQPPIAPPPPQVVPPAILAALMRAVTPPDLTLDTPDTALRYIRRQLKDASVYLFFNESDRPLSHSVTLRGKGARAEVWEPQTAAVQPISSTRAKGSVKIELALKPYETRVVVVR
ncbi:MAG: glycosyl hydrolase [Terriglobia bacterium]|jgi:hypothetical protein